MSTVAVIGLGQESSLIADGLQAAGMNVIGFDVQVPVHPTTPVATSIEDAVRDADIVLSLNSAPASVRVAEQVAPLLKKGALFADLNDGTPGTKKKLAGLFPAGVFVDVAIMEPVQGKAAKVSLAAAGTGAKKFIELMSPAAPHLVYVSDVPGDAAARQLLAQFVSKGITSVIIDALWAAETMGLEEWTWEHIQRELTALTGEKIHRLISETGKNFKRNQVELMDVVEMLNEAGYESTHAAPIQFNYGRIMHNKKIPFADPVPTEGTWTQPPTL